MMKILCKGVGKTFIARQGALEVLRDVELEVPEGEFCCLVGPSGCGKSTLLRILAGLTPPTRAWHLFRPARAQTAQPVP
jgi:ABC-type sugar transport system ATPase subunit